MPQLQQPGFDILVAHAGGSTLDVERHLRFRTKFVAPYLVADRRAAENRGGTGPPEAIAQGSHTATCQGHRMTNIAASKAVENQAGEVPK